MSRKLKFGLICLVGIVLVVAVLWCPYQSGSIPDWRVQVIDASGQPVVNVRVHEEWLDPIDEGVTYGDDQFTDKSGVADFPPRKLHNRLAFSWVKTHPSAHIFVCWNDQYGDVFWDVTHPNLAKQLLLRRAPCGYG